MPRKKDRRVTKNQGRQAPTAVPLARKPVVLGRANSALIVHREASPAASMISKADTQDDAHVASAVAPAHRLFWAWYNASVDTVRYAFDVNSMLVREMLKVSPVSLALQCHVAFNAYDTTDHGRALA